jgi:hypothetical protein
MKIYCVFYTQLFLADKVRHKLQNDGSTIALKESLEYYHREVVFADILFYNKDDDFSRMT